MDATAFAETIGQVKAQVEDIKKLALPRAEAEERMKKAEDRLDELVKAIEDWTDRQTANMDVADVDSAGKWMAQNGVKSMKDMAGIGIHQTNRMGQTIETVTAPPDVERALANADELHVIDALMTRTQGRDWLERKASEGFGALAALAPRLADAHLRVVKDLMAAQGKTLTSTTATTGDEWVPTLWASNMFDQIRLANPVMNLIPHVNQPSNPWRYPLLLGVGRAYRKIENTNAPSSDLTTGQRDWTAHAHSVYQAFADEMDEDSIVAVAPAVRAAIIRAMAEGNERALVNGDNDGAGHFDNDYQYASGNYETYQTGMSGLRHFALDAAGTGTASTFDAGTNVDLSFQHVGDAAALMGKFAAGRIVAGDLALLVNTQSWLHLLVESGSPLITPDKYGSLATILTGEVARVFNIPIFVSQAMEDRKDSVSNTGANLSGGTNTFSTAILFNRMNFRIGDRRDFRLEQDRDIVAGRTDLVGTMRLSTNSIEGDVTDANWDPQATPAVVAIVDID